MPDTERKSLLLHTASTGDSPSAAIPAPVACKDYRTTTPHHPGMLQLHHLTIGYRGHTVAHDLCAAVPTATLTALIGRNGSGKSTLLRSIGGLRHPLAGKVTVTDAHGRETGTGPTAVSVVLTTRHDVPALSVADTVALGRLPYTGLTGRLKQRDREAVEHAIATCGIGGLRHRSLQTLSDGERQRVMLARTLAQDTPVILLDEPTAFLDYSARIQTISLLKRLCKEERKTIIFSTHDLEAALPAADILWAMADCAGEDGGGMALLTGTPQELAGNGTLHRIFPEYRPGTAAGRKNSAEDSENSAAE